MKAKLLFIQSFGCQMNVHDAQRMVEVLRQIGYQQTEDPRAANLIIVNTCSVREKPQSKVISVLERFGRLKRQQPELLLAVAGCVAQQEGERLFQSVPSLDLIFSPDHIRDLCDLVEDARRSPRVRTGFVDVERYSFLSAAPRTAATPTALVTIIKGCDNHCSYCIVPQVRGVEVSRAATEVLAEVHMLAAAGTREVTLIGQNVNSYRGYHGGADDFVELLRAVDQVPGLDRIRFTTSHPKDFSDELARCFAELRHLCPWLHLPVQSGSTAVLASMNRGYSRDDYLRRVERVRAACPDIAIGTDLIVGFAGETEAQFEETVSLVEQVQFDYAFSFKYSVRPGTPAAALADDVAEAEKSLRLHRLQTIQEQITAARLARWVGRVVPILVEGPSRRGLPQLSGRTPGNKVLNFEAKDGAGLVGSLVDVHVTAAGSHSLTGRIADTPSAQREG
jgi:tRNA-2-methylthio-N6-dimethylallyladenosine synthase